MVDTPAPHPPRIDLGWVLVGSLDGVDRQALRSAIPRVTAILSDVLPAFQWHAHVVARPELDLTGRPDPVSLLEHGLSEREPANWDFTFVVTHLDLQSRDRPHALAAPSRALAAAALSTARLDPGGSDDATRSETIQRRVVPLALHLLGHLVGLEHAEDATDFMFDLRRADQLDAMRAYSTDALATLESALGAVADQRLEEDVEYRSHAVLLLVGALWVNRVEVIQGLARARPWTFPLRFARLTTPALSALLVVMLTAEAWELGMSQTPGRLLVLGTGTLIAASLYLLHRQHVLFRHSRARATEHAAVADLVIMIAVVLGMIATFVVLFVIALVMGQLLYPEELIRAWSGSANAAPTLAQRVGFSAFTASLGLIIGALGASLEAPAYFRHVAYVDEEV